MGGFQKTNSCEPSPTTAAQVESELSGRIAAVVDGGVCQVGVASTILDVSRNVPVLLRQGSVTRKQLEQVLGKTVLDGTIS